MGLLPDFQLWTFYSYKFPCFHTFSHIGILFLFYFFLRWPFCSQWAVLWRPLPTSHRDFYTCTHFVICPVTLQTASALLGLQWKKCRTTWNGSFAFQTFFLKMFLVLFLCLRFGHLLWDKYWSSVHREKVGTTETVCSRLQPIMWQTKRKNMHNQKNKIKGVHYGYAICGGKNALANKFLGIHSNKMLLVFPCALPKSLLRTVVRDVYSNSSVCLSLRFTGNGGDFAGKGPWRRRGERPHARSQAISHPHQSAGQTRAG